MREFDVRPALNRLQIAALCLTLLPAPAAGQQGRAPDFDALAFEAAERLAEYIRVRTVNPPGNETAGARWMQQVLAREGIPAQIFESSPGRGNLYARLPGNGSRRPEFRHSPVQRASIHKTCVVMATA